MKNILLLLLASILLTVTSTAQPLGGRNSTIEVLGGIMVDSGQSFPLISISAPAYSKDGINPWQIAFNSADTMPMYYRRGAWTEFSSGGGSLTIGNPISGGTNGTVLYENASGNLAESVHLTFDGTTLGTKELGVSSTLIVTDTTVGFFNATAVKQPSGDVATALSRLGLVATPTYPTGSFAYAAGNASVTHSIPSGYTKAIISVANTSEPTTPFSRDAGIASSYTISGTTLTVYLAVVSSGNPGDNYLVTYFLIP
jgi:hypothetical protein